LRFEDDAVCAFAKLVFFLVEDETIVALVVDLLHFNIDVVGQLGLVLLAFALIGLGLRVEGLLFVVRIVWDLLGFVRNVLHC